MIRIYQANTNEDIADIRELFWEYLQWVNTRINEEFNVDFDIELILEEDMQNIENFYPPYGRLLLVKDNTQVIGLACLRRIRDDIGEIKRMYIREEFRGEGLGKLLLEDLLIEAKDIGYPRIRLDSARFMEAAHSLYSSSGFYEIDPYPESEIPDEFQRHWIFMEKKFIDTEKKTPDSG